MEINKTKRLFQSFIRAFAILFIILVVLPMLLDQFIDFVSGGLVPGNDSIKVFKDLVGPQSISRFLASLKKIIIFM